MKNNKTVFAIYKDDEFIDLGTAEYLAKKLNVKISTIYFFAGKSYKKRLKNRKKKTGRLICIKIGKEDDLV